MSDSLISVIVPCYNLELYTEKCLNSILGQTYKNLEVIAIDDGSSDNTLGVLKSLAHRDERLRVLSQKNMGAGNAINRGIEEAKGSYLAFVDNDDWIEPNTYECMINRMRREDADVVVCNYNLVYDDHEVCCYSGHGDITINIKDNIFAYFAGYCACPRPNNYVWSRIYKKEILKDSNVRFEMFRLGSDTLLNFKLLPRINRITYMSNGFYNYVQRSNSSVAIAAKKEDIANVYADVFDSLLNYYIKNGYEEYCVFLQMYAYTRLRSVFFYSRMAGLSEQEIEEKLKKSFRGRKISDYLTGKNK